MILKRDVAIQGFICLNLCVLTLYLSPPLLSLLLKEAGAYLLWVLCVVVSFDFCVAGCELVCHCVDVWCEVLSLSEVILVLFKPMLK